MREDSCTWVDIKLKIEGQVLLHLELRGFRSDHDMTVQLSYINHALVLNLREELFVPACVVTIFSGWCVVQPRSRLEAGFMSAQTRELWWLWTNRSVTLRSA